MKKQPQTIRKEYFIDRILDLSKQGLGRNQILEELNWSNRQLTIFINTYKLKNIPRYNNMDITNEQEQIIIGSLLGDGHIGYSGKLSKNCRLTISHSIKQLEYLKFKYNILKSLCNKEISIKNRIDNRFNNISHKMCTIKTKSLINLTTYQNNWYINNKKHIFISDFEKIEALGLAIWFMDDGYHSNKSLIIATNSFIKDDLVKVQKVLFDKFNIETIIRKDNQLYIRRKSNKIFINLIKSYIIPSMQYKIAPIKLGEFRETPEVDNPDLN